MAETIFSGVFERHPNLTMVVAEAGLGWVAYLLDRMDREYEEKGMSRTLTLSAKPSELFQQHMYISFQEEAAGACGAFRSSAWTTSSGLPTIPTPIAAGRTPALRELDGGAEGDGDRLRVAAGGLGQFAQGGDFVA